MVVRPGSEVHRATLARRDLAGFYFPRDVAPARALRRTQHTRIGRHGGGSVLRQRYGRVRAPAARGFRSEPARNAVRRKPYSIRFRLRPTARPHLTTSPRPVHHSCQGVRGHGGRHRHGPRPRRRCRLEGTPRDPRNSNPDAHSRARGTPRASPRLKRKNIRTDRRVLCHKTFEPEADPTPAPPPAELALADQARRGSVLRQGQVNGFWRARRATTRRHALGECNADGACVVYHVLYSYYYARAPLDDPREDFPEAIPIRFVATARPR